MYNDVKTFTGTLMLNFIIRRYNRFIKFNPLLNSFGGRKFLQLIIENIYIFEVLRRKKLKNKLLESPKFSIPEDNGFALYPPNTFKSSESAVSEAEKIFNNQKDLLNSGSFKKTYLQELSLEGHLQKNSPLMNFALDPQILAMVSKYLGTLPILREIKMMYSPNEGSIEGGSQFFHVDKEYPRMMKVFLFITPSTDEDGPLTSLSAKNSESLWKKMGRLKAIHRISDEQVFNTFSKDGTQSIIGEKGSVGFLDVARCLHFGSRPNPNSKSRLIVWFVYHHYCGDVFPFSLMANKRYDFKEFTRDGDISDLNKLIILN